MNETYEVRLAVADDLALLPDIEHEAAIRFEPYGLSEVMGTIVSSANDFHVACDAGRLWVAADRRNTLLGFALATTVGGNAHLDELDVLPEHGRRGIGTALVQAVHQWAVHEGLCEITLTTLDNIPWNRPFYERLGYCVVPSSEMSDDLRALLAAEKKRGLPHDHRVVMHRQLVPDSQ